MGVIVHENAGVKRTKRNLKDMAKRAEHPAPAWIRIGSWWSLAVGKQFASKGAYFGTPWKPYAYGSFKPRGLYSRALLVRSGAMKGSFVGRPMSIERYQGSSATYGSNEYKVIWHQYGTFMNGKRHIPPRPMLKVTPTATEAATRILADYILGNSGSVRNYL